MKNLNLDLYLKFDILRTFFLDFLFDLFYLIGYVFLSQIEFKMGDSASSQAHLAEADKISPSNIYTNFVRYLNKAGCSTFEYATDRDDVEEKVKKYYKK